MELLTVERRDEGRWAVLRLVGQLDVATAPRLRQALQEAQYGGARHVVLDVGALQFLDSFGLGVLVGGLRRARLNGAQFAVAGAGPRIRDIFTVTGLDAAFRLVAEVGEVTAG